MPRAEYSPAPFDSDTRRNIFTLDPDPPWILTPPEKAP